MIIIKVLLMERHGESTKLSPQRAAKGAWSGSLKNILMLFVTCMVDYIRCALLSSEAYRTSRSEGLLFITASLFVLFNGFHSQSLSLCSPHGCYCMTACNAMHGIAFLSVCLSVCQTRVLWRNERNLCPHFYTTLKNDYPSFLTRRMVGGGDPLTWNFWPNRPRSRKSTDF